MKLRLAFSLALRRFMLLAPMVALSLQAATFSLVAADYASDIGISVRIGIPIFFFGAITLAIAASWAWVRWFAMNEADREAVRELDPYQNDRLTPKDAGLLQIYLDHQGGRISDDDVQDIIDRRHL